ncbi:hypothetical protein BgiMline_004469 [Biomphalaria glabrata]|nr:hypothetical protein BgiMline_002578 [Biomphalaria glabrata]KAI8764910.1 hypothetical protein BgiMline_002580 [Biomphalaria glabrata]
MVPRTAELETKTSGPQELQSWRPRHQGHKNCRVGDQDIRATRTAELETKTSGPQELQSWRPRHQGHKNCRVGDQDIRATRTAELETKTSGPQELEQNVQDKKKNINTFFICFIL